MMKMKSMKHWILGSSMGIWWILYGYPVFKASYPRSPTLFFSIQWSLVNCTTFSGLTATTPSPKQVVQQKIDPDHRKSMFLFTSETVEIHDFDVYIPRSYPDISWSQDLHHPCWIQLARAAPGGRPCGSVTPTLSSLRALGRGDWSPGSENGNSSLFLGDERLTGREWWNDL